MMLSWIAAGLFALGIGATVVGRFVTSRSSSPTSVAAAARIIPVPAAIQQETCELLSQGSEAAALKMLRETTGRSLREVRAQAQILQAQAAPGTPLPVSYADAARRLAADYPELADQIHETARAGNSAAAIRELRQHIPLPLAVAARLVEALDADRR